MLKNPPANTGNTRDRFNLCQEDPLEEGMATHQYSCLRNPTARAWRATVHRVTELDTTEHARSADQPADSS